MLADQADQAFVIGWGTGMTAGELAALSSMKKVDVAEISSGVMEAAPLFDFASMQATKNPKIHVIQSDAYRALMRSDTKYDVIVSEPSNPWVTGVEMLFSREFLQAAKSRLAPGGVYAQWFHLYETDAATVELVLRTYADVFDHVSVWSAGYQDVLLLGLDKPGVAFDHYRLEERSLQPEYKEALARLGIDSFPQLLSHELLPVGVLHQAGLQGPIHTLYRPILNDQAGRAFFLGEIGPLPFTGFGDLVESAKQNSMTQGYSLRSGGRIPDQARAEMVRETFRTLGPLSETLMAQWISEDPSSLEFEETRQWMKESIKSYQKSGAETEEVGLARAERLARLFSGPENLSEEPVDIREARQAQEDYAAFYHHSAPFRPEALLKIWGRCRGGQQSYEVCEKVAASRSQSAVESDFQALLEACLAERVLTPECVDGMEEAREFLRRGD